MQIQDKDQNMTMVDFSRTKPQFFKHSEDLSKCPTCHGNNYILKKQDYSELYGFKSNGEPFLIDVAIKCPTCNGGIKEQIRENKKASSIPMAYYDKKYNSFDWDIYRDENGKKIETQKRKMYVDDFINHFEEWEKEGKGIYIYSKMKGSGKTFLASCICNELMDKKPIRTKFVSVSNLLNIAQSGNKDSFNQYERDPIALLCNCKLLVLDDLGQKNTGTEWLSDILFRILDERLNQKLTTIITSNTMFSELNIDDRITDRINKLCYTLHIPEYCVRSKEANQEKNDFLKKRGLIQ